MFKFNIKLTQFNQNNTPLNFLKLTQHQTKFSPQHVYPLFKTLKNTFITGNPYLPILGHFRIFIFLS